MQVKAAASIYPYLPGSNGISGGVYVTAHVTLQ